MGKWKVPRVRYMTDLLFKKTHFYVKTTYIFLSLCFEECSNKHFIVRRHIMLATFRRMNFPNPLKSLFVVDFAHVVYEVNNDSP
jgi:hypothetical protein